LGPFYVIAYSLAAAQLVVPARYAFVPLLIAACHLPNFMFLNLGIATFSVTRLVIFVGLLRAWRRGVALNTPVDKAVVIWAVIAAVTAFFHHPTDSNPFSIRFALVYDVLGSYLYFRIFVRDMDDLSSLCKSLILIMIFLAIPVAVEKITGKNNYALMFGGFVYSEVREGHIRAKGPFGGAIPLGIAAATAVPLVVVLWRTHRRLALVGIIACGVIVICSASSGPIGTLAAGLLGLWLWRCREKLRQIRIASLWGLLLLHMIMKAPVWYLLARVDFVGGSTGWHRAELINTGPQSLWRMVDCRN